MTHTPTLTNGFSRDFSEAGDGRAMTPDIREKAERLAGAAPLHIRIQPEGVSFDADPYADILSQALLEAHEAGMKAAFDLLNEPGALRANLLRGSIKAPDDLVWLHDTNGPVAAKVLEAHNAGRAEMREEAAKLILDNMLVGDDRQGNERLHPRTNPGNKVGFAYATAIRSIT